ncbi:hypothetical protein, partial [Vibrio kanaloae]|uniref:hypothetical protein n=1 Tax=Vibrio kanaloae TaxID=170673 RepID=UPI0019D0C02D
AKIEPSPENALVIKFMSKVVIIAFTTPCKVNCRTHISPLGPPTLLGICAKVRLVAQKPGM